MNIKYMIFDFDGTLADSSQGVIASIVYALESYGYQVPDDDILRKFFGPPLVDSFMQYIGVDEKTGEELTSKYRELYSDNAMYLVELYGGMRQLLEKLKVDGIKIAIASSKPKKFFDKLLKKLELTDMFDDVSGAALDEKGTEKKDIISTWNIRASKYKSKEEYWNAHLHYLKQFMELYKNNSVNVITNIFP